MYSGEEANRLLNGTETGKMCEKKLAEVIITHVNSHSDRLMGS